MDDYYIELLKRNLLPPLGSMMKNAELSVAERCKAIKDLADGSLAMTGLGAGWSAALGDQLLRRSEISPKNRIHSRLPPRPMKRKICRLLKQRRRGNISKSARVGRYIARSQGRRFKRVVRRGMDSRPRHRSSPGARDQTILSRVKALQGLVPGGRGMDCSVLLGEAADYMMFLRLQVGVLQSVAAAIERSQASVE